VSAAVDAERLKVGEVVMPRDQTRPDATVRYWVVFVWGERATVRPENRQGGPLEFLMRDLVRVYPSVTRFP
jgi:hypothetical protein